MSSILLFSGAFCHGDEVAEKAAQACGFQIIGDRDIISEVDKRFKTPANKVEQALSGGTSVFNRFTHEKERCLASVKSVLAETLLKDSLVISGHAGQLIPRQITHVLRVALIAETKYRVKQAALEKDFSETQAVKLIQKENEKVNSWVNGIFQMDAWDPDLYDIIIPMDKNGVDDAVEMIVENVKKDVISATDTSKKAVEDFALAARVEMTLGKEGHDVLVSAIAGHVILTINKHVLMLSRLEDELKKIAANITGVREVETKVGPGYYKSDIYRKFDVKKPAKVMLVDDEREYVTTLSERLIMRDVGTAVVYDGEEALSLIEEDEPEVMVLDLKMPGIDGVEVLRRVRKEHPDVEVIVLTGQGSTMDEKICFELGVFAYLEKPVDVDVLAQKMREAYKKVRERGSHVSDK